jgi:hypothetical protein
MSTMGRGQRGPHPGTPATVLCAECREPYSGTVSEARCCPACIERFWKKTHEREIEARRRRTK